MATEIVKDRQKKYGHPADVYELAAVFWSVVFSQRVSVEQVAECLALIKHAREINANYPTDFRDNRDDMAGYANVSQMIADRRRSATDQADAGSAQRVAGSELPTSDAPSAPIRAGRRSG